MMFWHKFLRFSGIWVTVAAISGSAYATNMAMPVKKDSKTGEPSYFVVRPISGSRIIAIGSKSETGEMEPLTFFDARSMRTVSSGLSAQAVQSADEKVSDEKEIDFKMMEAEKIKELIALGTNDLLEGNVKRAQSCFEVAANKGGFDVELCYQKAMKTFNMLIQEKNASAPNAYRCLAWCLEHGKGAVKNMRRAILYYRLAASVGDIKSQLRLAEIYRDGIGGVAIDLTEARRYALMARANQVLAEQRERAKARGNDKDVKVEVKQ